MGLVSMLERRSLENPATSLADPAEWLLHALGAERTWAGVSVSPQTAMRQATVASCHRIIGETVASLPLVLYERLEPRGKKRATGRKLYRVLHDQVNSEKLTSFGWREMALHHLCGWGRHFAEIEFDGAGEPIGLWPLLPDRTRAERKDGKRIVVTRLSVNGTEKEVALPAWRVLHVPGLSLDGVSSYGYIELHRQMIGGALAAEEFAARFFGNGLHLGVVIEHPQKLSKDAKERIRTDIEYLQGGLSQAHRLAIFEEGMKINRVGIPPDEAQFLETRKFDREQIAMIYRVPLHMLQVGGNDAGQSFSSVEQKSLEFVTYTIRPWLVRLEQAINTQLLAESDAGRFFAEHLVDGLLRGDYKTRMDGHAVRRQWGLASYNDIAEVENWEFDETAAGNMRLVPMNMVPADLAREVAAPSPGAASEAPKAPAPPKRAAEGFQLLLARRSRAFEPLFRGAVKGLLRLEASALKRMCRPSWLETLGSGGAEEFYARQFEIDARRLLAPVFQALGAAIADDLMTCAGADLGEDGERAAALALDCHLAQHRERSLQRLREAYSGGPSVMLEVERVLESWQGRHKEEVELIHSKAPAAIARSVALAVGVREAFGHTEVTA